MDLFKVAIKHGAEDRVYKHTTSDSNSTDQRI